MLCLTFMDDYGFGLYRNDRQAKIDLDEMLRATTTRQSRKSPPTDWEEIESQVCKLLDEPEKITGKSPQSRARKGLKILNMGLREIKKINIDSQAVYATLLKKFMEKHSIPDYAYFRKQVRKLGKDAFFTEYCQDLGSKIMLNFLYQFSCDNPTQYYSQFSNVNDFCVAHVHGKRARCFVYHSNKETYKTIRKLGPVKISRFRDPMFSFQFTIPFSRLKDVSSAVPELCLMVVGKK